MLVFSSNPGLEPTAIDAIYRKELAVIGSVQRLQVARGIVEGLRQYVSAAPVRTARR